MSKIHSHSRFVAVVASCLIAAGSAFAASFSTTVTSVSTASTTDLSDLGTLDWVKYSTWTPTPPTYVPGTLTGTSMALGSGIGALETSGSGYPGVMAGTTPSFTWDNGDSPASGSNNVFVARYNWQLNGSAVAATTERTLYLFIGVMDGAASVSINLPGAATAAVPITRAGGGIPSYSLLAITFTGDIAGDNLTFNMTSTARTGIGAAALTAAAIPEPSTSALLLGCVGLIAGVVIRRRR